jgi:DNA primase
MKYRAEDIENLIAQLKIEEVVGEFVQLKKAGVNFKGLCPFHKDSNPSFIVSPSKNICKCFVCGVGGNPVKFYAEYKKINFFEAAEELAKKYNIPLHKIANYQQHEDEYKIYFEIMEEAHKFFCEKIFSLQGREALEYLTRRNISPQFIKDNFLGFAPHNRTELYDYLISKGYKKQDIITMGLVKEGESSLYDTFRGRIIFPIYSPIGKIIAFGGRTLSQDKEIAKYINSPETPIFKKGKNLYGIKDKGQSIKKKNYSILMEGYMDVLTAHSFGFDVALAPLGTALTLDQAKLLKKYTQNVILSFDMDKAGQIATEKAAFILKSLGFNIRVLQFEDAKDPDEFLKIYGKEKFLEAVRDSLEIFDFLYSVYSKEYNLEEHMAKINFINRFKEFFQNLSSDLEKTLYLDKLSKSLNIGKDTLNDLLITNNQVKIIRNYEKKIEPTKDKISPLEELTLSLILRNINFIEYFKEKKIESDFIKKCINYIDRINHTEKIKETELLKSFLKNDEFTKEEKEKIVEISMIPQADLDLTEIFTLWFIIELREFQKKRIDIRIHLRIKQIETELKKKKEFSEILELYEEFLKYYRGGFIK